MLVVVEPTRAPPKECHRAELDVWVQSTELGVDAFVENDQLTGWVDAPRRRRAAWTASQVSLLDAGSARPTRTASRACRSPTNAGTARRSRRRARTSSSSPSAGTASTRTCAQPRTDAARWLVYDDRGMYKPGEEVRVKGWVRRAGDAPRRRPRRDPRASAARPSAIRSAIRATRRSVRARTTVDEHGGFDLAFKLPGNANLGNAQRRADTSRASASTARRRRTRSRSRSSAVPSSRSPRSRARGRTSSASTRSRR